MDVNRAILVLGVCAVLAWGLGASRDEAMKVGIVDVEQVITSIEEGKQAREELERKRRDAEAKLAPLVERAQELLEEYQAKKFVLSQDALIQKQSDIAELQNQIQNRKRELEGQLEIDRSRLMLPMQKKLSSIVEEIGRENGFALILQRGAPGLMYTREALDITDLIIEHFDKKG